MSLCKKLPTQETDICAINMWSVCKWSPAPPKCKGGIFINVSSFCAMNS